MRIERVALSKMMVRATSNVAGTVTDEVTFRKMCRNSTQAPGAIADCTNSRRRNESASSRSTNGKGKFDAGDARDRRVDPSTDVPGALAG